MDFFDLAVIGGGPGGYVCAIRAAQLGLRVALVEKEKLGGTCLNRGCIPTKVLLQSAKLADAVRKSEEFGISCGIKSLHMDKIVSRSQKIMTALNSGVSALIAKNKITMLPGTAQFQDKQTLIIDGHTKIQAKNIVIATGAVSKMLPSVDEEILRKGLVITSKEAISLQVLPKKILIIGSGAIGIEFASFYNSMGSMVTVVEIQKSILIMEDSEISKAALKILTKKGIRFLLKTKTANFREEADGGVLVDFVDENGAVETEIFDVAIVAIGVVPNTGFLNLEDIGVVFDEKGNIIVDEFQKTNIDGIYAIGDVAEPPFLAHKASREGVVVAEKIFGVSDIVPKNLSAIPSCVYSSPQVASIGMTEEEAILKKIPVKIGRAKFSGNGKSMAAFETEGFVKVLFDEKTGELLGAHMIGAEVSELISIFSVAIAGELTEREIMSAVFPHPTMSEVVFEAVSDAFGMAIHG